MKKEIIEDFIGVIRKMGFKETNDKIGYYLENAPLFYKEINPNEYLIFVYSKQEPSHLCVLDANISYYKDERLIGVSNPDKFIDIVPSFDPKKDSKLLVPIFNGDFNVVNSPNTSIEFMAEYN